jgi:type II secretory ATPase GspE/PulE/Tfp pilus assembly ATPase PilB-like protein
MVMDLLRSDGENFPLQKLGVRDRDVEKLGSLISIQNGIVVIAGPTDSLKLTPLHSMIYFYTGKQSDDRRRSRRMLACWN